VRIAVAGTHGSGKSTLIEDFLSVHPEYAHEPEPYDWLGAYGEESSDVPGVDEFHRQLEISVERLRTYPPDANVIAERSPIDFLAYILALVDLGRAARDCELAAAAAELAAEGVKSLDLIAVLPLEDIPAPADEDLELRDAMNDRLLSIVAADEYSLFRDGRPAVVELAGSRRERLRTLESVTRSALRS
jgi:hypothetical protein